MQQDKVSIIIPTYNSKEFLRESVDSALNQSHKNIEVIVVDDGSTDDTVALFPELEKLGVKCFSQENKGACAARNLGLRHATGDYVQYLDADDLIHEDKLAIQLKEMLRMDADLSMSFWGTFTESIDDLKPYVHENLDISDLHSGKDLIRSFGMKKWAGAHHQYIIRKDVIDKAGEWNETLLNNQDGEYFARVFINANKMSVVKQQLAYYRVGQEGTVSSINSPEKIESALKSWDLISELIAKDFDKSLMAYPKKGYYVIYMSVKHKFPEYAKICAQKFDSIEQPCFLNEWKYYWIVKRFGLYFGTKVFWGLLKFKLIKTNYYPI